MRDAWSADRSERSPHGCSQIRMGDTGAVRNLIKAGEADLMQPSKTLKEWTPLHIAWTMAARMPLERVWDMPAVEAMLYCAAQEEQNGARFVSPAERARRRDLMARAEAMKAQREAGDGSAG